VDNILPGEWRNIVITFTAPAADKYLAENIGKIAIVIGADSDFYIWHPKLEQGENATDWSYHPEDL
jgi:hypothetical protein